METKKSIWAIITGGLSSVAPILFSVCKGGACIGVCVSPVASLFGVSSAAIASSPLVSVLEPLLIAISAVSFTISYYSLYVLPKIACNTGDSCDCGSTEKDKRKTKITKAVFWIGLILSIGFLSYFEYSKYQTATNESVCTQTDCGLSEETSSCADTTACDGGSCGE